MTNAAESTASATLSGRELALKRRQAMALHGKAGVAKTGAARPRTAATTVAAASAAPSVTVEPVARVSDAALIDQLRAGSPRQASRARREALSQSGKAALQPTAGRPSGRVRPSRQVSPAAAADEAAMAPAKDCGCGCNGQPGGCGGRLPRRVRLVSTTPPRPFPRAGRPSCRADAPWRVPAGRPSPRTARPA